LRIIGFQDRRSAVTELVTLFSAMLKTYPTLMKPLTEQSSTDLTRLILETHEELSKGKRINTPDLFFSCVKEDVPEEDWKLAVHCTRTWGPTSDMEPDLTADDEIERMTMELLWMSAMITELQQRELGETQPPQLSFDPVGPVQ
jgi:hypothetical protein